MTAGEQAAAATGADVLGRGGAPLTDPLAGAPLPDPLAVARAATYERWRREGRTEWIPAAGTSMLPLVRPGDELLVAFGGSAFRVGEILLVRRDGGLIAHRLVSRRAVPGADAAFVTKGDAEPLLDRPTAPADVLGSVCAVRTSSGRVIAIGATRRAVAAARISWWCGRAASWANRRLRRAPAPVRRRLLPLLLSIAQLPLRFVLAPIART